MYAIRSYYGGKALAKGGSVLLGEHGGGNKDRHLIAVLDDLESAAGGNLGLAVAHIPADQTIHGLIMGQIINHFINGLRLTAGLIIGKGLLELSVQIADRAETMPLAHGPFGIDIQEFLRHFPDRITDLFLGGLPPLRSQPVKLRLLVGQPLVPADPVETINRNVELILVPIADEQEITSLPGDFHVDHALKNPDTVVAMDNKITLGELFYLNSLSLLATSASLPARTKPFFAKKFRGGEEMQAFPGKIKSPRQGLFKTMNDRCIPNLRTAVA